MDLIGKGKNLPQLSPDAFGSRKVASLAPLATTANFLKSTSASWPGISREFNNLRQLFQRISEIVLYFSPFSVAAHHNGQEGPAACGVANLAPWILTAFSSPTIDFLLGPTENSAYYKNHNWGRAM